MAQEVKEVQEASTRATWSGKWAFILAAAASAVGLGNLWRFPYLAAKYGGGMFLFTYLVLVLTFGVSLLLLETALGRKTRQSVIGAFRHFGAKFTFIGVLAAAVPFIITPYYCIIGGWVTKYMVSYVTAGPAALADGGDFFGGFISSNTESFLFMLVFMAIVFIIVALGVQKGIEKANLIMMPALIVMAIAIACFRAHDARRARGRPRTTSCPTSASSRPNSSSTRWGRCSTRFRWPWASWLRMAATCASRTA